jgi:amidase
MHRRDFLGAASLAASLAAFSPAAPAGFELDEITLDQISAGLKGGRFTAASLTRMYLERIQRVDKHGPAVNSVIEVNPDAEAIAAALDREAKSKGRRGPLHGVPVLIKDNIDTGDKMMTTAGSLALLGAPAPADSGVARKLREAGAVILGKTNLSEWANFRSTHSVSGWSGRGGQTRNPYALDRNPCGSSSGSGAAVSANLCALAVGTETDGSIVCPSSMNGVVGIKPTVGLISRAGIVPISHSQDTAGPMARSLKDAAILLTALAGPDPRDPATTASAGHVASDYTQFLDPHGLKGARIGVARRFFGISDAVDKLMDDCIVLLRREGATVIDGADLQRGHPSGAAENIVLQYEFKADLNAYFKSRGSTAQVHSLAELISFNEHNKAKEMPYFGQELLVESEARGPLTDAEYLEAVERNRRLSRAEGIDAVLKEHKLDALVAPSAGPAWLTDWLNGDHDTGGCSTPAAVAGYPHITVPAGFVFGLPVGISFFGTAWSEPVLLKLAYGFETASKARKRPRFLPTVSYAS